MRVVGGEDFGAIVRQRRLDQGINQRELAQRVGRTRQWLSRLERGTGDVSLSDALKAAREIGLVVDLSPSERSSPRDGERDATLSAHEYRGLPAAIRQIPPAELALLTDRIRMMSPSSHSLIAAAQRLAEGTAALQESMALEIERKAPLPSEADK